jgi:hypothetical protein
MPHRAFTAVARVVDCQRSVTRREPDIANCLHWLRATRKSAQNQPYFTVYSLVRRVLYGVCTTSD